MFHRAVLGVESHNLDLFSPSRYYGAPPVRPKRGEPWRGGGGKALWAITTAWAAPVATASAWHLADTLQVCRCCWWCGPGYQLDPWRRAAGAHGVPYTRIIWRAYCSMIAAKLWYKLAPDVRKGDQPAGGRLPAAAAGGCHRGRHLGLKTAGEIANLQNKIKILSDAAQKTIDWPHFAALFDCPLRLPPPRTVPPANVRIAVARDAAFCFYRAETLEAFAGKKARAVLSAPSRIRHCPPISAACTCRALPGTVCCPAGSQHRHAQRRKNGCGKRLPTVAECGGFLYLGQTLEDADGKTYPMAGVCPGKA